MNSALAPRGSALLELSDARFENTFVRDLPADAAALNTRRLVLKANYTRVAPTAVAAPRLLAWSDALGQQLGLARPAATGPGTEVLAGNRVLPGMEPYAARYGGHQFGVWAGQLGDGRAITLGELIARDGSRQELQLKGAGLTPYSRTADGRAVLRSSLREFLCSEAMHFLGVPTTRALSLVGTGESVIRDMFYDGNPQAEPGAVVCRVAPSFLRFGNFQIHAAHGEAEELKRLVDYVMRRHFPEAGSLTAWFHEICRRTAVLMSDWMRLGFVHGVMNTDNMCVLGLTIDYGPYGWLEGYDPMWTPNTTDAEERRYCYGNQPQIALWNLARFAEALLPLMPKEDLEAGLELYGDVYQESFGRALAQKLGLAALDQEGDEDLLTGLFAVLNGVETDFTLFFRGLSSVTESGDDAQLVAPLRRSFYAETPAAHVARLAAWLRRYLARAARDGGSAAARAQRMNGVNPKYVPRNYLAQQAIDSLAEGDAAVLERLMKVLERPYDELPENDALAERRPEWARHKAGCSALSCSS
ncbi:MAG: YdiU family protein [Betaproteobacteria bacterium]|nr:YdiU family protein [Betaproteobacteria bacterium]